MPAVPRLGFPFIDVGDVADLHLRAMTEPAGGGQRFHRRRPLPLAARGRRDAARAAWRRRAQGAHARRAQSPRSRNGAVRPGPALGRRRPRAPDELLEREGPHHAWLGATPDRELDRGLRPQPPGLKLNTDRWSTQRRRRRHLTPGPAAPGRPSAVWRGLCVGVRI
jgi:nucleoside-diphosphate-sugar epimerase